MKRFLYLICILALTLLMLGGCVLQSNNSDGNKVTDDETDKGDDDDKKDDTSDDNGSGDDDDNGSGDGDDNGSGDGDVNGGDGEEDTEVAYQVVFPYGSAYGETIFELTNELDAQEKTSATFVDDSFKASEREIVLGRADRAISDSAYKYLSRMDKEEDQIRILIYSDGTSVALAFDEGKHGLDIGAKYAIDRFIENYVLGRNELIVEAGTLYQTVVDQVEYQRELEIAVRSAAIEAGTSRIEDPELRTQISRAISDYFNLMSGDVIEWFANLYDPGIGGFYYSNSARNTEGYLPDLESTSQALTFLTCCGVLESVGGLSGLPEEMKQQIVAFVKPLQNPNGYFYHPQWDKITTDKLVERRARDLSGALHCLRAFGASPTYDTPTGAKGDGMLLDGTRVDANGNVIPASIAYLEGRLSSRSSVSAVSSVILISNSYVSPALVDEASFRAYLEAGNVHDRGYGFGSELSSQVNEIKFRDQQLKEQGADYSLCEILIQYLNDNQNPDNGVWYWVDKSDERYSYYAGVNGLLKISGIYTAMGEEFPHATEAAKTAIEAIYSDENPVGIVDIYNIWFSIENLIKNLNSCVSDKAEGVKKVEALRSTLLLDAPAAIRATMLKLSLFRKLDGSFSYLQDRSSNTSNGMPVAVPGTNEGDINATLIGGLDTSDRMFSVLKISVPELYGKAELYTFFDTLENLTPVIKNPEPEREVISFDYDDVGYAPTEVNATSASDGEITVIDDPRENVDGNVLKLDSKSGGNDRIRVGSGSMSLGVNCLVFETDMCVVAGNAGYACQIYMGESYMLGLRLDGERVHLFDSSSADSNKIDVDLCASMAYGEWFNLRVEYYTGDHSTVRIKVYLNSKIIAVSDNYYDYYGTKIKEGVGVPSSTYPYTEIMTMKSGVITVLFDNMLAEKNSNAYIPYTDPDNQPPINVDSPEREELIYGFEDIPSGENYPSDFIVNNGDDSLSISDNESGKELLISGGSSNGFVADIPCNVRIGGADCSVFEADIRFDLASVGASLSLMFTELGYYENKLTGFHLVAVNENGETYFKIHEAPNGTTGSPMGDLKLPIGVSFKLRIEFYESEKATLIYVDGKLVAMSSVTNTGVEKYSVGKLKFANNAKGSFNLAIDNLKFEKCVASFAEAAKPEKDRIVVDFDSSDKNYTVGGSATVGALGGDNAVVLKTVGSYVEVALNKRSETVNSTVFEATVNLSDSTSEQRKRIIFTDTEGKEVLVYELRSLNGKVGIYEVTKTGVYETAIATFDCGKDVILGIEYFTTQEIIHLSLNGNVAAITSLSYGGAFSEIAFCRISALFGVAPITVDDIILESLSKLYIPVSINSENVEDGKSVITFENSTSGNLPSSVTAVLGSGGASAKIKECQISEDSSSKALVVETSAGGADTVVVKATGIGADSECVVLETAINVNLSHGNIYLIFYDQGGNQIHRINLNQDSVSSGGALRIDDNSGLGASYGYGTLGNPVSGKFAGEWFDLRIEFVNPGGGNIQAVIFVDGEYFGTSTEAAWSGKLATNIAKMQMTTSNGSVGSFALDSVSLTGGEPTSITK